MGIISTIFSFLKENAPNQFKIESVEEDLSSGLLYFLIKVEGKCAPLIKRNPLDLIKENSLPDLFSRDDFDLIVDSILENQKRIIENKYKNKFSLIKHQFSDKLQEPLIIYKDLRTKKTHIKTAKEIYSNINYIKEFNSEDSACIGNIMGCYETELEHEIRKKMSMTT